MILLRLDDTEHMTACFQVIRGFAPALRAVRLASVPRLGSRRIKARLGKAEGITATAHSRPKGDSLPKAARRVERSDSNLARILYGMIASGKAYDQNEAFKLTPSSKARRILNLQKQAQAFGFQPVPAT